MNLKRLFYMLTLSALAVAIAACGGDAPDTDAIIDQAAEVAKEVVEEVEEAVEAEMAEVVEELECTDELGCVEIDAGDPINIAYMFPTSGPVAFLGEDQKGGVEIAIDDRGGMLIGHEIELTGEDSLCSAEGGQAAAQKVASDTSVTGIIGTACSSAATAALPIISEAGLSMISSSNTAPTLTDADQAAGGVWMAGYYRTAHNDLFQGRVAAEFAYNELGARTMATVHDGSPYADGLQAVMADVFVELGGEITFQGAVNVGDTDMRPILTEIASNAPDVLYFPIFEPEAPLMVAQSTEVSGLENTILFGADAALVASFPGNAGAPAAGMYLSGPYVAPEGPYGDLLTKWDEKFGGAPPSGFHGHAYDAANMLMDAIAAVAQQDADGNVLVGRQAIRDYLSGISGYSGVIGELSCNETGDCATGEALGIFQITDAEISDEAWPPAVIYTPATGMVDMDAMMEEEAMEEEAMADEAFECTDDLGCVEVDAGDPINIAYMLPTSGPVAFLGEDQKGGAEIAIDDRGGELLGHEIELTGEDSLCSAEGGQSAAQKVASDTSVTGIIGTACSSAATAALPIISEAGLSMISSSNTAPTLTDADQAAGGVWMPGYFRTAHNDLFQGRVAAEFAYNELGARTMATVHDGSPYADGLQAVMAEVFVELGGEITFQGAVNVGDTDMRPILTEIASNAPDVLYFPIFEPEAPLLVAQSVEISGLENTILFGADAALVASFPGNAGAPADGMYLSGPYVAPEGPYGDLLTKWDEKFGGAPPSGFHGHAYDATNMLMDAIEAVAKQDEEGNLLIGRQAIRDYLSGISGYAGVIGELSCNETGDCATGEALGIFQITDAEISDEAWPPAVIYTP